MPAVMSFAITTSYAAGTNTSGSTANGTTTDCRSDLSVRFCGTITNGATAPTTPAVVNLEHSPDNGTTWYIVDTVTGSLTNADVVEFDFFRPNPAAYLRLQVTGNTGQSVTYASTISRDTGIG